MGVSPQSVVVDPTGKFAYVANAGCRDTFIGSVSIYTINVTTGALQPIGAVKAGTSSQSVAVDPSGNFVYVANDGYGDTSNGGYGNNGNISIYTVDPMTGLLTARGTVNSGGRAASLAVHSSGKFAYVVNGCTANSAEGVSMFSVDNGTGALTSIGTIPTGATGPSACSIHIGITLDASGRFAYVAGDGCGLDTYPGYIAAYAINPTTGVLTAVGPPIAAGYCSGSVSVDRLSKFAYVPNSQGDDVSPFAIGSTGALTSLETVPTGSAPVSSAVHPSGKYAYVVNRDSNNVWMYAIDSTTGILTAIGTIAAGSSPSSIAMHPSGKFAYVTNANSSDVSMYSIDADTGALTLIGAIGT
jgi:YVTN family beta-propeller protein